MNLRARYSLLIVGLLFPLGAFADPQAGGVPALADRVTALEKSVTTLQTGLAALTPEAIAKAQGIQHPFQTRVACPFGPSAPDPDNCFGQFTLPTNQRLVIEYVSVFCRMKPSLQMEILQVTTTMASSPVDHKLPIINPVGAVEPTGASALSVASPVRLYADAGTTVIVAAGTPRDTDNTGNQCTFNISGQAVDVP